MRIITMAVAVFMLTACGGDDVTGPSVNQPAPQPVASVVGTWDLNSIDGQSLPYTFDNGLKQNSGVIVVSSATYTLTEVICDNTGCYELVSVGTWAANAATYLFTNSTYATSGTASVSNNVITLVSAGYTFKYEKR